MALNFELPIIFQNHGIPPRHRRARAYSVSDTAVFSIPVAAPGEVEPALTYRHRYLDGGQEKSHDTVLRQYDGHLVREVKASESVRDGDMTVDKLLSLGKERPSSLPKALRCPSMQYHYEYSSDTFPLDMLTGRSVDATARDAVVQELQAMIAANFVVDGGIVYSRVHDPKINVWIRDEEVQVDRSLIASGRYNFPVDRPDLVEEFTAWLHSQYGLPSIPHSRGSYDLGGEFIFDHANIPLSANPAIEAAIDLTNRAELNISNVDYYGPEVKSLGKAFRLEPTVENALAFAEEFERAALSGDYPGHAYSGNERPFAIFRKFVEIMPDEYKGDLVNQYSADISIPLTMPSFVSG